MNSKIHMEQEQRLKLLTELTKEQKLKLFQEITDYFIGEKATLFDYRAGFEELYIAFEKVGRTFLVKFHQVRYVKICREWIFGGLRIEIEPEDGELNSRSYYRIYDQHYFEVVCLFFWVFELFDDEKW